MMCFSHIDCYFLLHWCFFLTIIAKNIWAGRSDSRKKVNKGGLTSTLIALAETLGNELQNEARQ